jgi:hypothetical protein
MENVGKKKRNKNARRSTVKYVLKNKNKKVKRRIER